MTGGTAERASAVEGPGPLRVCTRCVMDESASPISFDADGMCNYCRELAERLVSGTSGPGQADLDTLFDDIKRDGRGHRYDCVVGVSGGVDSSYVLYLAVRHGLRPLAVHLDNGWNSELASHNISRLVKELSVDLYTHVIDWPEYRDLQRSFFAAHVVDIELLMDNAMLALNYQQAARHGLRHILSGANVATEGMRLPSTWSHYKRDARNIRAIQKQFGTRRIRTQPMLSTFGHLWYEVVRRIHWTTVLDRLDYRKSHAVETLVRDVGYRPYPYKHYESIFTRFYQAHILPRKFGYDKRRLHLSTLIMTGQLERREAVALLEGPAYETLQLEKQERGYVLKKLGFTDSEFEAYLSAPGSPHEAYGSEIGRHRACQRLRRVLGAR